MVRMGTYAIECVAAGYFLWLGLYIITRDLSFPLSREARLGWWRSPALMAGLAMVLTSWYLFGEAMRTVVSDRTEYLLWWKLCWGTIPVAMGLWFCATLFLPWKIAEKTQQFRLFKQTIISVVVLSYAIFIAVLGIFTESIFRYQDIYARQGSLRYFYIPLATPGHYLYITFLIGVLAASSVLLFRQYRQSAQGSAHRRELALLTLGSLSILLAGMISTVGYVHVQGHVPLPPSNLAAKVAWYLTGSGVATDVLAATLGLYLIGRGVVNYNALMQSRIIVHDYRRSLLGVAMMAVFFVLAFATVHWLAGERMSALTVPLLIFLVILALVPLQWTQWILNKWILPRWEEQFRLRVAEVEYDIMTATDQQAALQIAERRLLQIAREAQSEEMLEREVESIFYYSNFTDDDLMAKSQLHNLAIAQQATNQFMAKQGLAPDLMSLYDKASALRYFITHYLDQKLCPEPGKHPPKEPPPAWIEYLILRKKYVEGKSRGQVEREIEALGLTITGGTYTRHLQQARKKLAMLLWQEERRARQAMDG